MIEMIEMNDKIHCMRLDRESFELVKSGKKTIEMRLYDEKRREISAGDLVVFARADDECERVMARVTALHIYDNFVQLYEGLPLDKCGYTPENISKADPSDMDKYYSKQKQSENSVVGIELKLL